MENTLETTEIKNTDSSKEERYTFRYILSFIIPVLGFLLGSLLLTRNEKKEHKHGIICLLFSILNVIIFIFVTKI